MKREVIKIETIDDKKLEELLSKILKEDTKEESLLKGSK